MSDSFVIHTALLDGHVDSHLIEGCVQHLAASGRFYRAAGLGWVQVNPATHQAVYLPRGPALDGNLSGLVQLVEGNGRTVKLGKQTPYLVAINNACAGMSDCFPQITGLYTLPAVVREAAGLRQAWPGYHHGLYFTGAPLPPATLADCTYSVLRGWFEGIQFQYATHRSNLMGYIIAALARPALRQFPLLVLDGTSRSIGKTSVASAINRFLTGHDTVGTFTGDEAEVEKRIGGFCGKPGPNVIVFDNIRPKRGGHRAVRSQFFASAVTHACPAVRPNYGKALQPIDHPVIILTMNDALLEQDLHDRSVRVILTGTPGRRLSPEPSTYAGLNRTALLHEAMHLLQRIDLTSPPAPRGRLFDWEAIAAQAGALLYPENPPDYAADLFESSDAEVREFDAAIRGYEGKSNLPPSFPDLAMFIRMAGDDLPELYARMRQANLPTDVQRGHFLRKVLEKLLHERSPQLDGRPWAPQILKNQQGVWVVSLAPLATP